MELDEREPPVDTGGSLGADSDGLMDLLECPLDNIETNSMAWILLECACFVPFAELHLRILYMVHLYDLSYARFLGM